MVSLYPLFKKWSKNKKRYRPNGLTLSTFQKSGAKIKKDIDQMVSLYPLFKKVEQK